MKLLNTVVLCLCAILTVRAHAQENSAPPAIPAAEAPAENNKEFNQDLDDFEKNISKEVPPTKPGIPGVDKSGDKARTTMKDTLAADAPKGKKTPPPSPKTKKALAAAKAKAKKKALAKKKAAVKKAAAKKKAPPADQ